MELEQFIQKYNTEDIINAIIIMSADTDPILTDTNIPAAEWLASNVIRFNTFNKNIRFEIEAYNEMKQISSMIYAPMIQDVIENAMKHKDESDDSKLDYLKSTLMKLKNMSFRGDAYQFQLMEIAERFYKPFDADFMKAYGFSFSCCESVFVYIYKRYMQNLLGTQYDYKRIEKIQKHSFRISKADLYQKFSQDEIDRLITSLSIKPGDTTIKLVKVHDFKPLYSKPIIDFGEYIYFPLPVSTLLNFPKLFHYSFIAERKFDKVVIASYTKNRGDVIEDLTKQYLSRLFDNVYISLKYPTDSKEFEADITVQCENTTIFAEAKGKILTLPSLNGNLSSINDDIYKAIGKAYDQAVRSIEHLEKGGLFINDNNEIVPLSNTTWKFPICVMSDNFASIPSEITHYLDLDYNKLIPYAVNIYDLDIITRECNSKEEFINYLLFRQMNIHKLTSMDELDFFGYFKQYGLIKIINDADEIWVDSYTKDFDTKYYIQSVNWFSDFI